MPEIGEVARIVHYLRKHLVDKTISSVRAEEDDIVYGKVGCSASAFQNAMTGKVIAARQQGKYFWLEMDKPPHPVMHFGMTGWMHFSNDDASYYKPPKNPDTTWPPKYLKFLLKTSSDPPIEVAFVDTRRLARIRLIDAPAAELRNTTPLKENGPDPVVDKDILTADWLSSLVNRKKVPIKALLLDQANISGIGNWVGDEVLFQARIHPEQYSNTLTEKQIKQLHNSMVSVCTIACETMAESDKFPENWLMKHRWNKGKKEESRLPSGEKIVHLTVGGRTSAIVPSVQKKTGAVAGDVNGKAEDGDEDEDEKPVAKKGSKRGRTSKAKEEDEEDDLANGTKKTPKKRKETSTTKTNGAAAKASPTASRRSSRRLSSN